jgi:hypothetical protein
MKSERNGAMPKMGYMLKDDVVAIGKTLISGNELIIYHPGRVDPRFAIRLDDFLSDFGYEKMGEDYESNEDYSTLLFAWQGDLED